MFDAEYDLRDEEIAVFADLLLEVESEDVVFSEDDSLRELQELIVATRDMFVADLPEHRVARRIHGRLINEWVEGGYDRRDGSTPFVTRLIEQISGMINRGGRQRRAVVSLAGIVIVVLMAAAVFVQIPESQAGAAIGAPVMIGIALGLAAIIGIVLLLSQRR